MVDQRSSSSNNSIETASPSSSSSRFVCPNDRQLALRAKLKTGWSLKTSGVHAVTEPIRDDEQQAIIRVIKRAEEVDYMEQERVGKLVERLENMRRNTYGKHPNQCVLCGDRFRLLGGPKLRCQDCKHCVCNKCSIGSANISFCMICAETREIWKKSGAWFYKSFPQYVLPGQKLFGASGAGKKSCGGASGSRARYECANKMMGEEESSSDEEQQQRAGTAMATAHWKHIERKCSANDNNTDEPDGRHNSFHAPEQKLAKEYEPLKNYLSHLSLGDSKSWGENADALMLDYEKARRDSLSSRSLSDCAYSDEHVSPGASSSASSNLPLTEQPNKPPLDLSYGVMELALSYDPIACTLHCTVYRAKNLIPMDINGLADPFCKLNILPSATTSTRLRTKTVHKTRNPEFNENLTFYEIGDGDLATKALHILMVDDDKYGHDYMGELCISLNKLRVQNTIYLTQPLEKLHPDLKGPHPGPDLREWFDDLWLRGQILISLCYSTKKRALLVTIVRCANLLPMDNNGFSDPFVKLQLRPDQYHRKHKTSIKWKNLNPVFNEEFAFESRPVDLATQRLQLTVWDKDYGKSNDYLGGLIVGGVGSKGQRLKHWLDMIRYPDHRHECWHNLTEDLIID